MKNLSTGTGLALLATAIVAYPIVNRISSVDQTAHASMPVAAIAAAATAQANPEPTIVWYGHSGKYLFRAWSDGRVEATAGEFYVDTTVDPNCLRWRAGFANYPLCELWQVVSDPAQGLTYRSDINFDEKVDGADLGQLLADWGDAPRYDIPPSDCPLNLINP